jgi:hypothetical protein
LVFLTKFIQRIQSVLFSAGSRPKNSKSAASFYWSLPNITALIFGEADLRTQLLFSCVVSSKHDITHKCANSVLPALEANCVRLCSHIVRSLRSFTMFCTIWSHLCLPSSALVFCFGVGHCLEQATAMRFLFKKNTFALSLRI